MTFHADKYFKPLLTKIETGQIKTTHQLRLCLDELANEFNTSTLSVLEQFREWLLLNGIELSTTEGMVGIKHI